jgi:FkbM family methyltransferase
MSSEIVKDNHQFAHALAVAGCDERLRNTIFDALREGELRSEDPVLFRETVRWPLVLSLLRQVKSHRVILDSGLVFEVTADSRIEKALLLSTVAHPDHVWEPQTTKLLVALATDAPHVIVGGAYIGDQVLPLARTMSTCGSSGTVHAFEPMKHAFDRLVHHLKINNISNVATHRLALWNTSNIALKLDGHLALASSVPVGGNEPVIGEMAESISVDDYVISRALSSVSLIMLDTEGGEENALLGSQKTIARDCPNIVFEIHRNFVDWSDGLDKTAIVTFLTAQGYEVFAIRDFHSNYPMAGYPVEIIPASEVYLDGPPHGFNMLATKDADMVDRLGLKIVKNVSPKLILEKDPALHFPLNIASSKADQ